MPQFKNYEAEIGWKANWQDALPLPGADPVFLDNSKPNRGLNAKSSNYSNVNDYKLCAAFDAVIENNGTNTTYRVISPPGSINDYDTPSVSPRDFDCVITIRDIATDANLGPYIPNRTVIMRAVWSLVNGGDIADYADAWAIHRLEVANNRSYQIYEYSSIRDNLTGIPLLLTGGFTDVQYSGNTIITECFIDGTQLAPGAQYKLSARLGLPQVFFNPPTALIDNITPDTETGITDWDITFTTTDGTFDSLDILELKVYNSTTNAMLYTLTGNYNSNISTFAGAAFASYLSGTVVSGNTLTFNKLQWAIDNNLINEDAIPVRFELTITQYNTGLTSNIASGVFDVEIQDAQYIGDLRYFDTDGRKIYSSNFNGVNTIGVAVDITLRFSTEIFPIQNGTTISSIRTIEDSTFGPPWSKLLISEGNISTAPYQWITQADTSDGIAWNFTNLLTNIAGAGRVINLPTLDELRQANGQPVFWVGLDLITPNLLFMIYYDGAAWQAVDFSSKVSGLISASAARVAPCVLFQGDVYGFACANGPGGEKRVFRLLQTSGDKTDPADFLDPANWSNATVMAGSTSPGTSDGNGASAEFANPYGMIIMANDGTRPTEMWLSDGNNYSIRKLEYNGGSDNYDVTTIVGVSGTSGDVNDTGTDARLGDVRGICTDYTNVYIGDLGNRKIKRVNISTLAVTTFSGTGANGYRIAIIY